MIKEDVFKMKLTLDKFKQRHIFIKEQKKDKIPDQCSIVII